MNKKIRLLLVFVVVIMTITFSACSNLRWGTNAGVDLNFGPNGVRLDPHVSMDLYSGGRLKN